jgi:hypothetical protein
MWCILSLAAHTPFDKTSLFISSDVSWRMQFGWETILALSISAIIQCDSTTRQLFFSGSKTVWNASHGSLNKEWILSNMASFCQTHSTLLQAVRHMMECTERWKIWNTAGHIVQIASGDQTVSYSMGTWVISLKESGRSVKVTNNYICCIVKKISEYIFNFSVFFNVVKG